MARVILNVVLATGPVCISSKIKKNERKVKNKNETNIPELE